MKMMKMNQAITGGGFILRRQAKIHRLEQSLQELGQRAPQAYPFEVIGEVVDQQAQSLASTQKPTMLPFHISASAR